MKTWQILSENKEADIINLLLENRGIKTNAEKEEFLNPKLESINPKNVGIDLDNLKKAITRIKKAIKDKEQIVVFGDYDVDGITGSAILWETLNELGAKVMPYIPHRIDEGYGLSKTGITNVKEQYPEIKLIITVDNGIVANTAVDFAKDQDIDVIVTDHHTTSGKLPNAYTIIHTTKLCGAGVAYVLTQELKYDILKIRDNDENDIHLELAALGTIADLVLLTQANRVVVKHGLLQLGKNRRMGLRELFNLAKLVKNVFTVYDVGYIISPRLNAAGRIESAMDSLRLLCTKDNKRAYDLAAKLEDINKKRQMILKDTSEHAKDVVRKRDKLNKLLIVADESYQQGVIGLIAGKLVEEFYRPSIAISIGEKFSKGSVRSVAGFNIVEFLRSHPEHFIDVGGHPMAAGFTVETKKLPTIIKRLEESAEKILNEETLTRRLKIDCELDLNIVNAEFYNKLQSLAPFGMGNPEPVFVTRKVEVSGIRKLGAEGKHIRLELRIKDGESTILEAVGFGFGEYFGKIKPGDLIDMAYSVDENTWNGNTKIQLKIKDIKI